MKTTLEGFKNALDKTKIEAYTGDFYWRARDIQFLLNNCTWHKLYKSIIKIEKACNRENLNTSKDIIRTKTIINDGNSRYSVNDFYLSNLIAYQLFAEYNDVPASKISKRPNSTSKNIHSFKLYVLSFVTAAIVIFLVTVFSLFYIPFHPFREIRDLYIGTAMTTYSHQWLATMFFSKKTIDEVMTTRVSPDFNQNTIKLDTYVQRANKVQVFDISGSTYSGKLIKINNPEQVFVGISSTFGTRGEFLEDIINDYDACIGINGSGFVDENGSGKASYPVGVLISEGQTIYLPKQTKYDVVGLDYDNNLIIGTFSKEELSSLNLRDAVEPFYKLIINGVKRIKGGNGGYGLHPRTAIGQTLDGSILMLVIDGRQLHSIGATMKDCQDILSSYGAVNAAALDGGSSSIMYYDGKIQTKPSNGTTYGRYLPSAFLVKKDK